MTAPTEPATPEVLAVTPKRADQLCTGDLLWRDETQQWHQVFVLPTQPVAVPIPGGFEVSTNLHLEPNPTGPRSIATYTLPVGQVVLTAAHPVSNPNGGMEEVLAGYLEAAHAWESTDTHDPDLNCRLAAALDDAEAALRSFSAGQVRTLVAQATAAGADLRAALHRYEAADHACARPFPADLRGGAERRTAEEERRRATVALVDAVRSAITLTPPGGVRAQLEGILRDAQAASARWEGHPTRLETPHD